MKRFPFLVIFLVVMIVGALIYVAVTPPAVTPRAVTVHLDPVDAFAENSVAPTDPIPLQPTAP